MIRIAKKNQRKLFQLFCSLSKPREVDTEHVFILNAFFCSGALNASVRLFLMVSSLKWIKIVVKLNFGS